MYNKAQTTTFYSVSLPIILFILCVPVCVCVYVVYVCVCVWEKKKKDRISAQRCLVVCMHTRLKASFAAVTSVWFTFFLSLHKKVKGKSRQRVNGKKNCFDALSFKGGQKGTSSHRCFSFPREFR